jgi:hypothetical protein
VRKLTYDLDMANRRSSAPAEAGRTVALIRTELGRLRSSILRIEQELGELEDAHPQTVVRRDRPERYLRVLVEVYEHGGQHGVDADGLANIGARHGYDRRGLGGFFTGARAPLRRTDERIRLTPHGEELMDSYLARTER